MATTETLERMPERDDVAAGTSVPQTPVEHGRRRADLSWIFTALFGVFGWAVGITKLSDNSFFWHLRTGEYILDHGIPHHDVFSYTAPGTKWIAQSWLAEVTYAALYRYVGGVGIRLFVGALGACIAMLAYRLALRLARDRMIACGLAVAAMAGMYTVWSERPLLIGVLFFLLLMWVVEVPDSFIGRHPFVALPVLMWLWANTHGTFELGFAYLGLHLIGRWCDGQRPWEGRERQLLVGAAIAFAAVFVNPYGVGLVTFPIDLLSRGDILSHIVEWKSPDFRQAWGIALAFWIVVYVWAVARGRHRVSRRDLIVTIPMLLLALWAVRNVAIAPFVALPVVARAVARDEPRPSDTSPMLVRAALVVLVTVAVLMGFQASTERTFDFSNFPTKALRYVDNHGLMGTHVLTNDATGGYVILRYWPQQKVFIDDRYDMYPTSLIYDYFDVAQGRYGWDKVLDRYRVTTVVWERDTPLGSLLDASSHWKRVYTDPLEGVWVRSGS
jgi:hypothetical protein